MYINKVILYGNLTRDPELKALPSGMQVCEMGMATNRVWKDKNGAKQDSTDYHNVVIYGKSAELIKQYLKKGNGVYIEGRIQTRSWDAQDGTKKYRTEIIADNFQFGPKGGSMGGAPAASSASAPAAAATQEKSEIEYPDEEVNADDIPF